MRDRIYSELNRKAIMRGNIADRHYLNCRPFRTAWVRVALQYETPSPYGQLLVAVVARQGGRPIFVKFPLAGRQDLIGADETRCRAALAEIYEAAK